MWFSPSPSPHSSFYCPLYTITIITATHKNVPNVLLWWNFPGSYDLSEHLQRKEKANSWRGPHTHTPTYPHTHTHTHTLHTHTPTHPHTNSQVVNFVVVQVFVVKEPDHLSHTVSEHTLQLLRGKAHGHNVRFNVWTHTGQGNYTHTAHTKHAHIKTFILQKAQSHISTVFGLLSSSKQHRPHLPCKISNSMQPLRGLSHSRNIHAHIPCMHACTHNQWTTLAYTSIVHTNITTHIHNSANLHNLRTTKKLQAISGHYTYALSPYNPTRILSPYFSHYRLEK